MRPDSARGILRRLARITAPVTKPARTPTVVTDKENIQPEDEDNQDQTLKRPRISFDLDESLEMSIDDSRLPQGYDEQEEDSEVLAAPTPSALPEDDDDTARLEDVGERSLTFKSIDFANLPQSERLNTRKSRVSFAQLGSDQNNTEDYEDDPTILTERGRRAISEEMTGRLSRYSFGSIRMSDFGDELEIRRESDPRYRQKVVEVERKQSAIGSRDVTPLLEGETELLDQLRSSMRQSPSMVVLEDGPVIGDGGDDDFQLFVPEEEEVGAHFQRKADVELQPEQESSSAEADVDEVGLQLHHKAGPPAAPSPHSNRRLTSLENAALTTTNTRRGRSNRLKQTRHGTTIPSLPSSLIKRIATESQVRNGRRRPKLGKDHMAALEQATEWFFEQVGEDLAVYADHAKRKKKVGAEDVMILMRRTRLLGPEGMAGLRDLAKEVLPDDMAAGLDLDDD